ncbi:ATP-binding protein [Pelosinus propionicus]|uniref:Histidine kinase-, DNA gyrase B-, and HSP90-like ATPase n=1 Tax=Pelosinus propionicus DSM 13327 TaxID=1123291 RepID=A0A1I4P8B2_9FIRM|nr:hypothetical protein [Pelosinus propionicus]SFM23865.1 hypothetical protein SAMN04490355_105914 [Pelosinus propionicus DSM 13327]
MHNKTPNYSLGNNTITVTNLSDWREIDILWHTSDRIEAGNICTLDMCNISSLNPQAIVMLFMLCRKIKTHSSSGVVLDNLTPQIDGYLRRVNFFDYEVATSKGNSIEFSKNPLSKNLLELTRVDSLMQINKLGDWFYDNFEHWFPDKLQSMYRQLSFEAINELCSNSVEHSKLEGNGEGYFVLQKYWDFDNKTNVIMSVGDYGIGIRNHLIRKYPEFSLIDEAHILSQAISGISGRLRTGGGRGLKSICNLTRDYGGYLVLRSGCGLVFIRNGNIFTKNYSYPIPGTQCVFCLKVNI